MNKKLNYIKKGAKYIIGATILAISLGSASFGLQTGWTDNYYQIRTPQDLIDFAELVNKGNIKIKGKLFNDINFEPNSKEWIPIGSPDKPFNGELISNGEGKQYKITGLRRDFAFSSHISLRDFNKGLFGAIGKQGKVSNISVENSEINGVKCIGAIAGKNYGTISNCSSSCNNINGSDEVGGIAGYNEGTISDCICSGNDINGNQHVGGIAGINYGKMYDVKAVNGNNTKMNVSGHNNVGGIVGFNSGTINTCENEGTIETCKNEGILYKGTLLIEFLKNDGHNIGGIVGRNNATLSGKINNKGNVTGMYNIGGIIGYNFDKSNEQFLSGEINNEGNVIGIHEIGGNIGYNENEVEISEKVKFCNKGSVTGEECVGGNIGYNEGGYVKCMLHNEGIVNGMTLKDEYFNKYYTGERSLGNYIGGNIGYNKKGTITDILFNINGVNAKTIDNKPALNINSVSGNEYIGGNVGFNDNEGTIIREIDNEASVTGKNYIGGNVGVNNGTIESCKNSKKVEGENYVGGNVGVNNGTISGECQNGGEIEGENYVGGNVGFNNNNEGTIENCNNEGKVIGHDNVGGNIGNGHPNIQEDKFKNTGIVDISFLI